MTSQQSSSSKHKTMKIKFLVELSDSEYQAVIKALDSVTSQWIMESFE